MYTIYRFHN